MEKVWLGAYEKHVPHFIRYPDKTLPDLLHDSTYKFPGQPSMIYFGNYISYKELDIASNKLAHALVDFGLQKGDRVAVMLPNIPQAVITYYGILKAGGIVVQVNTMYLSDEIEQQVTDAGAEMIIILDMFYERVRGIRERANIKRIIVTGVQDYLPTFLRFIYPFKARTDGTWVKVVAAPPVYDFQTLIRNYPEDDLNRMVSPDDIALLQYTGGTTGTPKGVMLTHRNLVANACQCRHWMWDLQEGNEKILSVLPFFHVYGMTICMNLPIYLGLAIILLPKFKTVEVLKSIEKYSPSVFPGIQAMYLKINEFPGVEKYNISSIRACISGAGPLAESVQETFERLTGGRLVEGYGLSESSPVTHANPIYGARKKGSIGVPVPDTLARIVDAETGQRDLPPGEVGEILVKGPQVMKGYWEQPEETAQVLKDGWLYTGDMALMDEEGYFFIKDRKKDMIKTTGENVYPREVEEVLFEHPYIKEAVIVGIPDAFAGELIKAYVVLENGVVLEEKEIIAYCASHLAKFKVPKIIEFRKELPKTIIGKVLKRRLLEEELSKSKTN